MNRDRFVLVCLILLILLSTISGCTIPSPDHATPAGVLREYVLAYNRGDAATIYSLLLPLDHPAMQGQYTQQSIERVLNQTRYEEGTRIADYTILELETVNGEAFLLVQVTWEAGDGSREVRVHDVAMLQYQGKWKLADLLLPTTPGAIA